MGEELCPCEKKHLVTATVVPEGTISNTPPKLCPCSPAPPAIPPYSDGDSLDVRVEATEILPVSTVDHTKPLATQVANVTEVTENSNKTEADLSKVFPPRDLLSDSTSEVDTGKLVTTRPRETWNDDFPSIQLPSGPPAPDSSHSISVVAAQRAERAALRSAQSANRIANSLTRNTRTVRMEMIASGVDPDKEVGEDGKYSKLLNVFKQKEEERMKDWDRKMKYDKEERDDEKMEREAENQQAAAEKEKADLEARRKKSREDTKEADNEMTDAEKKENAAKEAAEAKKEAHAAKKAALAEEHLKEVSKLRQKAAAEQKGKDASKKKERLQSQQRLAAAEKQKKELEAEIAKQKKEGEEEVKRESKKEDTMKKEKAKQEASAKETRLKEAIANGAKEGALKKVQEEGTKFKRQQDFDRVQEGKAKAAEQAKQLAEGKAKMEKEMKEQLEKLEAASEEKDKKAQAERKQVHEEMMDEINKLRKSEQTEKSQLTDVVEKKKLEAIQESTEKQEKIKEQQRDLAEKAAAEKTVKDTAAKEQKAKTVAFEQQTKKQAKAMEEAQKKFFAQLADRTKAEEDTKTKAKAAAEKEAAEKKREEEEQEKAEDLKEKKEEEAAKAKFTADMAKQQKAALEAIQKKKDEADKAIAVQKAEQDKKTAAHESMKKKDAAAEQLVKKVKEETDKKVKAEEEAKDEMKREQGVKTAKRKAEEQAEKKAAAAKRAEESKKKMEEEQQKKEEAEARLVAITGVITPHKSSDAGCWTYNQNNYAVTVQNDRATFNWDLGAGNLVRTDNYDTFVMHDHQYSGSYAPRQDRAFVTYYFSNPALVTGVEIVQHTNGISQIEAFVGDTADRLSSIGKVFGPSGDVTGGSRLPERGSQMFKFDKNDKRGKVLRVYFRKTSLPNGYAVYRIIPHMKDGRIPVQQGVGITELWINAGSQDAHCYPRDNNKYKVKGPPFPLDTNSGVGRLISSHRGTFGLHDHVYSAPWQIRPDRAVIYYKFNMHTIVKGFEIEQHVNGIQQIELFVGDKIGEDNLVSIGKAWHNRGVARVSEREHTTFSFSENMVAGLYLKVLITRTYLRTGGYASYRLWPHDDNGRIVAARRGLEGEIKPLSGADIAHKKKLDERLVLGYDFEYSERAGNVWKDYTKHGFDLSIYNHARFLKNGALDVSDYYKASGRARADARLSSMGHRFPGFTVEAWVRPTAAHSVSGGGGMILSQPGLWYLEIDPSYKVRVYMYGTSNNGYHLSNTPMNPNEINHIAYTYDRMDMEHRIYVNGRLDRTIPTSNHGMASAVRYAWVEVGSHSLGNAYKGWFQMFVGRYYNKRLTHADIAFRYKNELPRFPTSGDKLVELLDQEAFINVDTDVPAADGKWKDQSGNGHDLSLNGPIKVGSDGSVDLSGSDPMYMHMQGNSIHETFQVGFTTEVWIEPTKVGSVAGGYQRLLAFYTPWNDRAWNDLAIMPNGRLGINARWKVEQNGYAVMENNKRYHIVMTYDSKLLRCYVNGKLDQTIAYNRFIRMNVGSYRYRFWAGGDSPDMTKNFFRFYGKYYAIRAYSRGLSEDEIQGRYEAEKVKMTKK